MIIRNNKITSALYKGTKEIIKRYKGTLVVYEAFKKLTASGVPPITLQKCKGVDLVDYKLYGNSVQSVTTQGKNLFDISKVTNTYAVTNNGDSLTIIGYGVALNEKLNDLCPSLKVGDTVVLNVTPEEGGAAFIAVNGVWINGNTKTITEADLTSTIYMYNLPTPTDAYGVPKTLSNIQIEYGSTRTEYEAFVPNSPSPEYPSEIESVGEKTKNLFDINNVNICAFDLTSALRKPKIENGVIYSGGILGSTEGACIYIDTLGNNSITISFDCEYAETQTTRYYRIYMFNEIDENGYFVNDATSGHIVLYNKNKTVVNTTGYKYVGFISFSNTQYGLQITNLQFEQGATATEYEPYGYKIPVKVSNDTDEITTNIYLNEPLRKTEGYEDYIDFENKKVVRNSKILTINNTTTFTDFHSKDNGYVTVNIKANNAKQTVEKAVISNIFEGRSNSQTWYGANEGIALGSNGNYIQISLNKERLVTEDVAGVKDYFSNNECIAQYLLATPIEETIELPNIPTIKGTTILEVDTTIQPSNLEVVYKGK